MALKQKVPVFARGSVESLNKALAPGGQFENLDRIVWTYISSGERQGQLAFTTPSLTEDGSPTTEFIVGDNPDKVKFFAELPDTDVATTDVLYVIGNKGYIFDGIKYNKVFDADVFESSITREEFEEFQQAIATWQEAVTQDSESLHDAIDATNTTVTELSDQVDVLNGEQAAQRGLINDISNDIVNLDATVQDFSARVGAVESSISSIASDVDAINGEMSGLSSNMTELNNDMTDLKNRVDTLDSNVSTLSQTVEGFDDRISSAEDTAIQASSDASEALDKANSHDSIISTINNTLSDHADTLTSYDTRISTNESDISTIQLTLADLQNLESRVAQAEEDIANMNTADSWDFDFDE